MSRIFDALQRSGVEESGVEYPDLISVVTEVFEAKRTPTLTRESSIALPELDLPPINLQVESAAADKLVPEKPVPRICRNFPRLQSVSQTPADLCSSPNPTVWPLKNSAFSVYA